MSRSGDWKQGYNSGYVAGRRSQAVVPQAYGSVAEEARELRLALEGALRREEHFARRLQAARLALEARTNG